ncbi:unnamed protein product, partial [Nesidiocoris tenuis]
VCDQSGGIESFRTCVRARAVVEGSHAQLGLLAFSNSTLGTADCACARTPQARPCAKGLRTTKR